MGSACFKSSQQPQKQTRQQQQQQQPIKQTLMRNEQDAKNANTGARAPSIKDKEILSKTSPTTAVKFADVPQRRQSTDVDIRFPTTVDDAGEYTVESTMPRDLIHVQHGCRYHSPPPPLQLNATDEDEDDAGNKNGTRATAGDGVGVKPCRQCGTQASSKSFPKDGRLSDDVGPEARPTADSMSSCRLSDDSGMVDSGRTSQPDDEQTPPTAASAPQFDASSSVDEGHDAGCIGSKEASSTAVSRSNSCASDKALATVSVDGGPLPALQKSGGSQTQGDGMENSALKSPAVVHVSQPATGNGSSDNGRRSNEPGAAPTARFSITDKTAILNRQSAFIFSVLSNKLQKDSRFVLCVVMHALLIFLCKLFNGFYGFSF
jgi:hypothetical protein